jgi:hypothetical protein
MSGRVLELPSHCVRVFWILNLGRHLVRAENYRDLRLSAFSEWGRAEA